MEGSTDGRTDALKHLVLIGGFPLPDLSVFTTEDLAELDDAELDRFRASAVPVLASVFDSDLVLENKARHRLPITTVCTEFSAADLQGGIDAAVS